jgi:hypothetical protein
MKITISQCLLPFLLTSSALRAVDILRDLPTLPSGFTNSSLWTPDLEEDSPSGGLDFSLSLNALYDSNVNQGSGSPMDPEDSDFIVSAGLSASYLRGDESWQLGVNANVGYRHYFERDDFNDPNYGLSVYGGYNTAKTVISFSTSFGFSSGVNVESGNFLEQVSIGSRLSARYRLSGKTSLLASWAQSFSYNQTSGFSDTSSWTAEISAIWQATSRINLGPGIRYGVRGGSGGSDTTVLGPTFRLNYDLSSKVSLRSSVGIDYTDSSLSGTSESLNWSLGLNYRASDRWGLNLSMIRDIEATPIQGSSGFNETTSVRLAYWRSIRQAKATLGISYQDRSSIDGSFALTGPGDSQLITTNAGISMPIFKREARLNFDISYRDFEGGSSNNSWDGFQTGMGLSYRF